MKRLMTLVLGLVLATGLYAQKEVSLSLDPSKADWFREAKFGLFLHWGLYSELEGSYDGHTLPDTTFEHGRSWYAEWIQQRLEVPDEEYQALAKTFNPVLYDPDEWVREAKNAGMRYLVITSKHHDGFALWNSKVSDFDVKNTPYKKDLLGPLVKACKKYGLKYGFYYSHWQDWEHPQGALPEWKLWRPDEEFEIYWQEKCLPQVKELITKYDPDMFWFDTWEWDNHITPERRDELIGLVRKYSDKCLINGRIAYTNPGTDIDFLEMLDNDYPADIQSKPWQTPATMQHSFGYHAKDYNWKSSDEMVRYLVSTVAKGGNYLLNIGPKADGTLPEQSIRRLREMGAWISTFGEGIYGTKPLDLKVDEGIFLTQKDEDGAKTVYAFLTKPISALALPIGCTGTATVLGNGEPLQITKTADGLQVTLTGNHFRDSSVQVVRFTGCSF